MINLLKTRMASSKDQGFTLIELLIVIVVLGILAGIAILGVSAFQSDASKACTDANNRINSTVTAANSIKGKVGSYSSVSSGACATS